MPTTADRKKRIRLWMLPAASLCPIPATSQDALVEVQVPPRACTSLRQTVAQDIGAGAPPPGGTRPAPRPRSSG